MIEFIGEYELRDVRYLFIKDFLKNGFGDIFFELLRYFFGGSVWIFVVVWKIFNEGFNWKRLDEVVGVFWEVMFIFYIWVMKVEFKSRFENIVKLMLVVYRVVYRFFIGDEFLLDNWVIKEVDVRMMIVFDFGDFEFVVDLC